MNLFLHLTPEDLTSEGTGAVSVEKLGAATTQLLADWLAGYAATGGKVILRPVLDLTRPPWRWTSTTHPPPYASAASCATHTASSPAADTTPAPATSTTSSPTSP